jgi:type I site-specific restriction-modification system R (restriction) subunit
MKQYSLQELFNGRFPFAMGEFRWRFVCAVTKENVREAWKSLKADNTPAKIATIRAIGGIWADHKGQVVDIKEDIKHWHNLPEDKKILRTFAIVATVLRTEEARQAYKQQQEEEQAQRTADYKRGAEVLYEYLKENEDA